MTDARLDPDDLPGRPCSAAAALELVGDRWALLAVREISFGNHRFNQIVRNTGAPRDRLAARLKGLVEAGVLIREEGYRLTEAGRELLPVIWSLLAWGDKWAVTRPPVQLEHRPREHARQEHEHRHEHGHGHEFRPATVCATCGDRVAPGEIALTMTASDWTMAGPGTP